MGRPRITAESRKAARSVGKALRRLRKTKGLSQAEFAELAGVHRTQAGFLERGEITPGIYTLICAARALGSTASEVLREAGY